MKLEFLKEPQIEFLKQGGYILPKETPQQRITEIVNRVKYYEKQYKWEGLSLIIKEMIDKNELSLSTPVFSNFGRELIEGRNTYDLPASCNIITVNDSIIDIGYSNAEIKVLSKLGAGVGPNYVRISPKGTTLGEDFYANSKLDWIEDDVSSAQKVSQGSKRRGYSTPYISILENKEDFDKLMERTSKKNPNKEDCLISNTIGIVIPEGFWDLLDNGDKEAQRRFLAVMKRKKETGKVYLLDEHNCNINSSEVYKRLSMSVETSNICTEFLQPLFDDMTSVCVISALNLVHWDELKKNPIKIKAAFYFLDIINEEYVYLTGKMLPSNPFLSKVHKAARDKRDIGLGALGLHELFQQKGYVFGDIYSRALNKEIFKTMREIGEEATKQMGIDVGVPDICKQAGLVRRNASLMMVAPNKSTSFISGATSGGIEPFTSNYFLKALAKIQHVFKNKNLEKLLESKGKNTRDVWRKISEDNGSVAKLDFLSDHEKDVYKTFKEISPKDIIDLAADRQEFIDMGQSLNLIFRSNYTLKDIYDIHRYGFKKGIKTFYYGYPEAHAALETGGDSWDSCVSCAD